MTNGEMIQKVFNCEVCEPIPEDDIIHVIFPDKNDSAIGFDWSWWNMEYEEPTTKNDLGVDCISRADAKPVIHAEWLGIDYYAYADGQPVIELWECSNCGYEHEGDNTTLTNYCPNCGAKMESEAEE